MEIKNYKIELVIQAISFDDLIRYGQSSTKNLVKGMPWSFEFKGRVITHETDECYLIPSDNGFIRFTPDYMLLMSSDAAGICTMYICKKDVFAQLYKIVN